MINYLPGFFGPSKFLWFLLRGVPQGPGPKVMLSELLRFFPIVAQDLSLFTFSPLLQRGRRAQFGLIRHSSRGIMCLVFRPLTSITQSLKFKSNHLSFLIHATQKESGTQQLQTSACPLFQHSHYLLLAYLTVFLQGVSLPSPILPYLPLHPSFITSTLSSSAPPPSLYPPFIYFLRRILGL